jgi:hypothetical protein
MSGACCAARELLVLAEPGSVAALTFPLVIALVALVVLSVLLFRGRSHSEPRESAADIQYRSGKTSGHFTRGRIWRWITRR